MKFSLYTQSHIFWNYIQWKTTKKSQFSKEKRHACTFLDNCWKSIEICVGAVGWYRNVRIIWGIVNIIIAYPRKSWKNYEPNTN